MAEGCTFVASPFKPSHCKLCFQAKVDHKIPTLKTVTTKPVEHKPVETKPTVTSTPKSVGVDKPVNASTPHQTPTDTPKSENVEVPKHNKAELMSKFNQDKPAETKPEAKPVKTYKYQTNPQPAYTAPTENKPRFQPPTEQPTVGEDGAPVEDQPVQPKKVYRPVGGVKMQGFDPSMLVNAATIRRAKKNLDSGELEETQGAGVVEPEPETKWEPTPLADSGNYKRGPGVDVLGGGLAALLQKRKQKEDAADALANPNGQASEIVVEEVNQEVTMPTMNKVFKKIEEAPIVESTPPENLPPIQHHHSEPEVTYNNTNDQQNTNDEGDDQDWS